MSKLNYVVHHIRSSSQSFSILKSENINNVFEYLTKPGHEFSFSFLIGANPIKVQSDSVLSTQSYYYLFKQEDDCMYEKMTPCLIVSAKNQNEAFETGAKFGFKKLITEGQEEYKVIDVDKEMVGNIGGLAKIKVIHGSVISTSIFKGVEGMCFSDLLSAEKYLSEKYKKISFRKTDESLDVYENGERILTIKLKKI